MTETEGFSCPKCGNEELQLAWDPNGLRDPVWVCTRCGAVVVPRYFRPRVEGEPPKLKTPPPEEPSPSTTEEGPPQEPTGKEEY
ncbi:MAG: hypothetical protein ACE5L6_02210 [Candidatus Bathyarchaeia archaeon]